MMTEKKAIRKICLVLLPCLFFVLIGCEHIIDPTAKINKRSIKPLVVGNYWVYGFAFGGVPGYSDTLTVWIDSQTRITLDGISFNAYSESWSYGISSPSSMPSASQLLYMNEREGIILAGAWAPEDTFLTKKLWRKFPGENGESFSVPVIDFISRETRKIGIIDSLEVDLVKTDQPFDTPAGTFECYVYRYTYDPGPDIGDKFNVFEYYAPGVGMVGYIVRAQFDNRVINQIRLIEYRLKR